MDNDKKNSQPIDGIIPLANDILEEIRRYFDLTKRIIDPELSKVLRDINISGYEFMQNKVRELPSEIEKITVVDFVSDPINFDIFDSLFNAFITANSILKLIAGEQTQNKAKQRMSQSYFEDLSIRVAEVNAIRRGIYKNIEKLISIIVEESAVTDLDVLYKKFVSVQNRSYFSYRLLVVLLTKLANSGTEVSKLTEHIKDNVFGLADSSEKIAQDLAERSKYHSIQAMGLTFGLISGEQVNRTDDAISIDLTMPTGKAIKYDLDALLEPSTETTAYGLNHKIITRLNTIRETDKAPGEITPLNAQSKDLAPDSNDSKNPQIVIPADPKSIIQTIDGGLTYAKVIDVPDVAKYKNCGAGPKLRIDEINGCIQTIMMSQIEEPAKLLASYQKKVESFKYPFASRLAKNIVSRREQKMPETTSRIDRVIFNALFDTFTDYWREFVQHLTLYGAVDDEANPWVLSIITPLTPKVSRIVKKVKSNKLEDLENALEDIADGIPMVPIKIFAKMLQLD